MSRNPSSALREIIVKGQESISDSIYPGNKLILSRYSILTLIPLNLFEQFQRISNLWFLLVSIFQLIPFKINPTDSWTTIVPLSILLTLTLIKDAYTDNRLRQKDKFFNTLKYQVWNGERFSPIKSENILVGQFIEVNENQFIPADLVIVASTNEGSIFLDMSRLVGVNHLALKKPVEKFAKVLKIGPDMSVINKINGKLNLSEPNSDYNEIYGNFKFDKIPGNIDISNKNMLFKGGILKGEKSVIGLVAYCGSETKLQLNTNPLKKKQSKLERFVNISVFYILLVLIFMVFISVIGCFFIRNTNDSNESVLDIIITFTLLYNNIIPISLFMVIDMIRLFSSFICSQRNKDFSFNVEAVNENLGQAQYLLTDKTGCITQDKLTVKACVVADKKYMNRPEPTFLDIPDSEMNLLDSETPVSTARSFYFDQLKDSLIQSDSSALVHQFVRCMGLCNDLHQHGESFLGAYEEIALVEMCKTLGFEVKIPQWGIYEIKGEEKMYFRVVEKLPFTRDRKSSRVLLQEPEGTGVFYVKGSPETMLPLLNLSEALKNQVISQLTTMKEAGLRSIILGFKQVSADDLLEIKSKIQRIRKSVLNTESRIEAMFKELEINLNYLGIAGLSEPIIPGCSEAIKELKDSGIKIWMLSSDSVNSTVLAAKESGIISKKSRVIELSMFYNELTCSKALLQAVQAGIFNERRASQASNIQTRRRSRMSEQNIQTDLYSQDHQWHDMPSSCLVKKTTIMDEEINKILNRPFNPSETDFTIVVDRMTLQICLIDMECRRLLTCLIICAKSVCFADLMPIDKGKIVKLLKDNVAFRPIVIGVGSGEGDINMIQTCDVGVGIKNREDSLVLNYSDINIGHFAQIANLILYEGHWMYTRMSKALLLYLYKNFFLTFVLLAYTFICDYTGTSIFNASLLVGFNLFFTSLPILVIGIFDEDISREKISNNPRIYNIGVLDMMFCAKKMISYVAISVVQGLLLVILIFQVLPKVITPNGLTEDLTVIGTVTYVVLVLAVLMQIHTQTSCYSWLYALSQVLSLVSLIIFLVIVTETYFPTDELFGDGYFFKNSPVVLFNIFLTSILCVLPCYAFFTYLDLFTSKLITKFRVSYSIAIPQSSILENFKENLDSLYRNTSNWKSKVLEDMFSMSKLTLKFRFKHIDKKFSENYIAENLTLFKWTIAILWILIILWTIFEALVTGSNSIVLARIIISAACSLMFFILWTTHFTKHYQSYIQLMIFLALITKFALEASFKQTSILATALVPSVTFMILDVNWFGLFLLNILNLSLFVISISMQYSSQYSGSDAALLAISLIVFIIAITATSALVGYFLEFSKKTEYILNNKAHNGVEQIESVLKIMLPPFVRNRVKEGVRYIAEDQGEVTILFCDICDFDNICKEYTPQELTGFLDYIFSSFDVLCEKIGVTKIETVGKTYMACSGLKDSDKDLTAELRQLPHARRCIELALAILQEVNSILLKNGNKLQVKIGINSGPVSAGVVGHHKPQFSLVGDTVNTASRMCSTLDSVNSIQISLSTYNYLSNYEDIEFAAKQVYAKGKGHIDVFKVTEAKPDNSDVAGGSIGHFGSSSAILNVPSANNELTQDLREEKSLKPVQSRKSREWKEQLLQRHNPNLIQTHPLIKPKFKETLQEREFRLKTLDKNYYSILISLIIATLTLFLMTIFAICEFEVLGIYTNDTVIISRSVVVIYLTCVLFLHTRIYMKIYYPYLIIISLLLMIITVMLQLYYQFPLPQDIIGLELMYIIVILNHCCAASLFVVVSVNFMIFIPWIILAINTPHQSLHLTNALLVAGFSLINLKGIYQQEKNDRVNYNLSLLSEQEKEAGENLLKHMMPAHVLEKLEKGLSVTDRLHKVTLIFADIVGFTDWSSSKRPEEIVQMLSNLFTRFDKLCVKFDVYKVHTIGDCYVVMGHVGRRDRDPSMECLNVMKMAYSMIEVIKKENAKHNSALNMRIGVHTGEVIAGVIGTNIVRYDIWGPDVLIANKMESNGTPGKVKCSEDTREMIINRDENFEFEESESVGVSAIGVVKKSYYVTRKEQLEWIEDLSKSSD